MKVLNINKLNAYKSNLRQVSFAQTLNKPELYKDEITFNNDFIKTKYGIDAKEIEVVADEKTKKILKENFTTKAELLTKIVEAHEHAKKALSIDNFSGRKFATNMMLRDGTWALGVSVGSNAENAICGERSAVTRLFSTALEKMSLVEAKRADIKKDFQVKYLAMASSKNGLMDIDASKPCGDCLSWLNEKKFFDLNTQIVSLEPKSKEGNTMVLRVKNLKDILPLRDEKSSKERFKEINQMKFEFTSSANEFAKSQNIDDRQLRLLLLEAKGAYQRGKEGHNKISDISNASAVLMSDGRASSAYKTDWTRRWFTHPSLLAISKILQSSKSDKDLKVNAVAYYGDKDVPYISSLAKIAQERGSLDTLVITIRSDAIKVRTISDYMPDLYVSSSLPKNNFTRFNKNKS